MNAKLAKETTESDNSVLIIDALERINKEISYNAEIGNSWIIYDLKAHHDFSKQKINQIINKLKEQGFKISTLGVRNGHDFFINIDWSDE